MIHLSLPKSLTDLGTIWVSQVTLSSLNRHALATYADVGLPKCSVMRDRLQAIVPNCEIEAVKEVFTADKAEALLGGEEQRGMGRGM
jgi:tRNA A37 threonylcarbamoyladenosine dehydratase